MKVKVTLTVDIDAERAMGARHPRTPAVAHAGGGTRMKLALCAALCALTALATPNAGAGPCQGVLNQSGCQPAPWNGQLLDTWNIPGTYGGWTNAPIACDPITTRCAMWAQP